MLRKSFWPHCTIIICINYTVFIKYFINDKLLSLYFINDCVLFMCFTQDSAYSLCEALCVSLCCMNSSIQIKLID